MDCRETQALLTAFHDGEVPAADRVRVEAHLRCCPECRARLADLARADQAAGVPDPGPAYWDRFNARVMDRVERKADDPKGTILRPKHGWMRQQFRYLVPAAAAAALVVGIVRYGGMNPGAPTIARDGLVPWQTGMPRGLSPRPPSVPPAAREPAIADPAGQRRTKSEHETRATKTAESTAAARHVPPSSVAGEQSTAMTREKRDRLVDRSHPAGNEEAARDRAAAPAAIGVPSPPPTTFQRAPDGQGRPGAGAGRDAPGSVAPVVSPCELARTLAARKRWRDAEAAQRICLARDLPAPSREKGLVFLAGLLDRQERFAEADAVITEVERQFPQSRPLELYRQQRPLVQKHHE